MAWVIMVKTDSVTKVSGLGLYFNGRPKRIYLYHEELSEKEKRQK